MKLKIVLFFILFSFLAINAQEKKKEEIPDPKTFVAVETEPKPIQPVKPVFPEEAVKKGLTGKVILRVLVDKDGAVKRTQTIMSSNKIFEQPAIDAIMKTKFSPAIQNGKPIMCWVNIPYLFNHTANQKEANVKPAQSAPSKTKKKNSK